MTGTGWIFGFTERLCPTLGGVGHFSSFFFRFYILARDMA